MLLPRYYFENDFSNFEEEFRRNAVAVRSYTPGDPLNKAGYDLDDLYYVKEGVFQVVMTNADGAECVVAYFGSGSMHPVKCKEFHFSLEHAFTMVATTACTVYVITPEIFRNLVMKNPELAVAAINFHVLYSNLQSYRLITQSYDPS